MSELRVVDTLTKAALFFNIGKVVMPCNIILIHTSKQQVMVRPPLLLPSIHLPPSGAV